MPIIPVTVWVWIFPEPGTLYAVRLTAQQQAKSAVGHRLSQELIPNLPRLQTFCWLTFPVIPHSQIRNCTWNPLPGCGVITKSQAVRKSMRLRFTRRNRDLFNILITHSNGRASNRWKRTKIDHLDICASVRVVKRQTNATCTMRWYYVNFLSDNNQISTGISCPRFWTAFKFIYLGCQCPNLVRLCHTVGGDMMNTIQDVMEMIETFYALKRMYQRLKARWLVVAKNATTYFIERKWIHWRLKN